MSLWALGQLRFVRGRAGRRPGAEVGGGERAAGPEEGVAEHGGHLGVADPPGAEGRARERAVSKGGGGRSRRVTRARRCVCVCARA